MKNFEKLHSSLYKLFLTDQNIANCLDDFPQELSNEFIMFVEDNYNKRFNLYYRYLTKANKEILKEQALRGVLKDWRNK